MNMHSDRVISPNWAEFRRTWLLVAVALFVLIVLLALFGFGPGGRNCPVPACAPTAAHVADTTAPMLQLAGSNPLYLSIGEPFIEPGVRASDAVDGDVSVGSSGTVDNLSPGTYTITYSATDRAGNAATVTRQVIVTADDKPPSAQAPVAAAQLPMAKVYFALGSADFPADRSLTLTAVVAYLQTHPEARAVISGYHDASGNLAFNQTLAKARAQAVQKFMLGQGIDTARITLEKPAETEGSGAPEEARRVEVRIEPGSA